MCLNDNPARTVACRYRYIVGLVFRASVLLLPCGCMCVFSNFVLLCFYYRVGVCVCLVISGPAIK